jgi:hypothetical protein
LLGQKREELLQLLESSGIQIEWNLGEADWHAAGMA